MGGILGVFLRTSSEVRRSTSRALRRSGAGGSGRSPGFLVTGGVELVQAQVLRGFHLLLLGDVAAGEEDGLLGGDVAPVPEEGAVRQVFAAERELHYRRAGDREARVGELQRGGAVVVVYELEERPADELVLAKAERFLPGGVDHLQHAFGSDYP